MGHLPVLTSSNRLRDKFLRVNFAQPFQVEVCLDAMDADISDDASRRDNVLAGNEAGRNADGLDHGVDAAAIGHLHDLFHGLAVLVVDDSCGPEAGRHFKPVVVKIDHDDFGRRVELGRQKRGESDRTGADDRHRRSRLNLPVEHAALEPGRKNVAE
jgi:hypothetical protein